MRHFQFPSGCFQLQAAPKNCTDKNKSYRLTQYFPEAQPFSDKFLKALVSCPGAGFSKTFPLPLLLQSLHNKYGRLYICFFLQNSNPQSPSRSSLQCIPVSPLPAMPQTHAEHGLFHPFSDHTNTSLPSMPPLEMCIPQNLLYKTQSHFINNK